MSRRYYFSADGLDKHSERLPAARHYDVTLERDEGTEGPNLVSRAINGCNAGLSMRSCPCSRQLQHMLA